MPSQVIHQYYAYPAMFIIYLVSFSDQSLLLTLGCVNHLSLLVGRGIISHFQKYLNHESVYEPRVSASMNQAIDATHPFIFCIFFSDQSLILTVGYVHHLVGRGIISHFQKYLDHESVNEHRVSASLNQAIDATHPFIFCFASTVAPLPTSPVCAVHRGIAPVRSISRGSELNCQHSLTRTGMVSMQRWRTGEDNDEITQVRRGIRQLFA